MQNSNQQQTTITLEQYQDIIKEIQKQHSDKIKKEQKESDIKLLIIQQYIHNQKLKQLNFEKMKQKKTDNIKFIEQNQVNQPTTNDIFNQKIKELKNNKNSAKEIIIETLKSHNKYSVGQHIASGGQGHVFDGYFTNDQGNREECAYKIYYDVSEYFFQEEINHLKLLKNSINIMKIIDSFQTDYFFILISEKCQKSLTEQLAYYEFSKDFDLQELLIMIFSLLDGLIQLKMFDILHSDIKPDNILIKKNGEYCFTDFGTSCKKQDDGEFILKGFSPYYAPNQSHRINLRKNIGLKSDLFSLGITFMEIIKVFKVSNQYHQQRIQNLINHFTQIINNNMIQSFPFQRSESEQLHLLFYKKISEFPECFVFEQNYFSKFIDKIKMLISNNDDKNFDFTNEMLQYYTKLQLNTVNKKLKYESKLKKNNYFLSELSVLFFTSSIQYINKGSFDGVFGDYKIVLNYYKYLHDYLKYIFKNDQKITKSLFSIPQIYQLLYNQEGSEEKYFFFQTICQQVSGKIYLILNDIGQLYKQNSEYNEIIEIFKQSVEICKKHIDKKSCKIQEILIDLKFI